MYCARRLHLVIGLATLLLLHDTMLFQEELVRHVQVRVVANLRPSTKAVSVDANQEHGILLSTP